MPIVIYLVRCKIDGREYVGQTSALARRWNDHKRKARGTYWLAGSLHEAMHYIGEGNFTLRILQFCLTRETADAAEFREVELRGCRAPNGFNLRKGGSQAGQVNAQADGRDAFWAARGVKDEDGIATYWAAYWHKYRNNDTYRAEQRAKRKDPKCRAKRQEYVRRYRERPGVREMLNERQRLRHAKKKEKELQNVT